MPSLFQCEAAAVYLCAFLGILSRVHPYVDDMCKLCWISLIKCTEIYEFKFILKLQNFGCLKMLNHAILTFTRHNESSNMDDSTSSEG